MLGVSTAVQAEEWRMVIARPEVVVMVDAETVRKVAPLLSFHVIMRWPKLDEDGAIGNIGNTTFDCVRKLVKTPGLRDIHPDGTKTLTRDQKTALTPIMPNSLGDLIRERMCRGDLNGGTMTGVPLDVPTELAATSVFSLLALGLNSDKASILGSVKYPDEESLGTQLDAYDVPTEQRDAVRKVLASQTRPSAPPPPPIVPLASAVATGLAGNYVHSEHELVAQLQLRVDGTFRYGLTVGSLDEAAAGRWTASKGRVHLVSDPRPVPPTIASGPVKVRAGAPFSIRVVTPRGSDVPGVDFVLDFATGQPLSEYTRGSTWALPKQERRTPRFVTFQMPSYGLRFSRLAIDGRAGHVATFLLTPNDISVVDMTGLMVSANKDSLTRHRAKGSMQFDKTDE